MLTLMKLVVIFLVRKFEISVVTHDWIDWILDSVILYRILELLIINNIRKDVVATNKVVKESV